MNHISVCVCTYKRPIFLARLLRELQNQITENLFTYSIVVVDNDRAQSAKSIVETVKKKSTIVIDYYNEPEQNIALARNKAVENAKGNYISFIDDDEFPVNNWLLILYKMCKEYEADGVLGPVKPHFEKEPPQWIIKGKLFERPSQITGTELNWRDTRTGNVLLRRDIFNCNEIMFDPEYGAGGEDKDLFRRMIEKGYRFIWCNEAPVFETVPPERWGRSFFIKRYFQIGGLTGVKVRKQHLWAYSLAAKATIAFILYAALLPFSFVLGRHIYTKCLMKVAYNYGWIFGFCGFEIDRYKNY